MREYQYTDYAINNANSEAIVYRFANGTVREITVDDFGGDVVAFNTWKSFSDNDYHISYDNLEEMDLGYSEDCLEVMVKTEEEIALSEGVEKLFSILSEKQRRRLYLYVIKGMKQEEIARIECCSQVMIHKSIDSAKVKIKKYFEKISKTGYKNASEMAMGERVNFYMKTLASYSAEICDPESTLISA